LKKTGVPISLQNSLQYFFSQNKRLQFHPAAKPKRLQILKWYATGCALATSRLHTTISSVNPLTLGFLYGCKLQNGQQSKGLEQVIKLGPTEI
jgi:hypothetical protein